MITDALSHSMLQLVKTFFNDLIDTDLNNFSSFTQIIIIRWPACEIHTGDQLILLYFIIIHISKSN